MASPPSPPPPPECPICLNPYSYSETVPLVLSCGHSVCRLCLLTLPRPLPNALRCPICAQLVPSLSLPRNIDLLRFSSSTPSPPRRPSPIAVTDHRFTPLPLTDAPIVAEWKDWIIPYDAIEGSTTTSAAMNHRRFPMREGQKVSLLNLFTPPESIEGLSLTYAARVVRAVSRLEDAVAEEVRAVLWASMGRRGLGRVYGLWMEGDKLFLVCDGLHREAAVGVMGDDLVRFAVVGVELCEAVMGLHCESVACGCLAMSCFGLDGFEHWLLDLSGVVEICRNERGRVVVENDRTYCGVFVSPEVFVALNDRRTVPSLGCGADVWSLACVLITALIGDGFVEELFRGFYSLVLTKTDRECEECLAEYEVWLEGVVSELGGFSLGTEFEELKQILCECLNYDPGSRPQLRDLWKCMKRLISNSFDEDPAGLDVLDSVGGDSVKCLVFSNICSSKQQAEFDLQSSDGGALERGLTCEEDRGNCNLVKGLTGGALRFVTLEGHRDSVSGLAVGGGFLFSSSFDKTIHVWSLQDFSHVETLKGHEHRVTALVISEANKPLCISGDSGSGIFVWDVGDGGFLDKKPLKNWYDHKDWRYSGVHSLAVSGLEKLYSGSGDKTIKAWSLQDYSLICTMSGHKSAVSSLTVCDNVLYSGSWDGTVRLWWLHDHTPLAVLGDETLGNVSPVLSLSVSCGFLVASHESGCLKIWKNAVLVSSTQDQSGAIFALHMDGKWLFFGGWEKIVAIQELSEDEIQIESRLVGSFACDAVITCLLYYNGKLFVGFANKDIKVYNYVPDANAPDACSQPVQTH